MKTTDNPPGTRAILLGHSAPTLNEQLKGLVSDDMAEALQKLNVAISQLRMRSLLTDSEVIKARKRLVRECGSAIHRHAWLQDYEANNPTPTA